MQKYNFKIFLISLVVIALSNIANAQEKKDFYFEIGSGIGFLSAKENDSGNANKYSGRTSIPVSGSLGFNYSENLRWDLNLTYLSSWNSNITGINENINSSINSLISSVNIYYEAPERKNFKPYLTAGVGISLNTLSDSDYFYNNNFNEHYGEKLTKNFAWKIGLGVSYQLNNKVVLDLGYRFTSLGKAVSNTGYEKLSKNNTTTFPSLPNKLEFKEIYAQQILFAVRIPI